MNCNCLFLKIILTDQLLAFHSSASLLVLQDVLTLQRNISGVLVVQTFLSVITRRVILNKTDKNSVPDNAQ